MCVTNMFYKFLGGINIVLVMDFDLRQVTYESTFHERTIITEILGAICKVYLWLKEFRFTTCLIQGLFVFMF